MAYQTMPRVFDYAKENGDWTEVPSPCWRRCRLSRPSTASRPSRTTINPKAVWSDGQPITSDDFKYTWDQIAHGKNIYDPTGYNEIESVDTTNPKMAVVTFSAPFGAWTQLFGADYGDHAVAHPGGQEPRRAA